MMELITTYFAFGAVLCFLVSFTWLITLASKKSANWIAALILFGPFAMLVYATRHHEESKIPSYIFAIGLLLFALAVFGMKYLNEGTT